MITIENPLDKDVVFDEESIKFEDENCNMLFSPIPFKIPAEAERNFEIKYRPLVVGKFQNKLTLTNEDLGTLNYDLTLEGISTNTEKIMKFQVPLGSKQPRPFKFIHYCQKQTTYQCRIEKIGGKQMDLDPKKKVENLTDFEVKPPQLQ